VSAQRKCLEAVGPIPKLAGHTCRCNQSQWHPLPHHCDCGSSFEPLVREGRLYDELAEVRRRQRRRETGQLIAWSLMLGVLLVVLSCAWFGIIP
jgi:hypothetical protein